MHNYVQYLSSRRGVYSGFCALVALFALILLSGTMGQYNNTEYGQISQKLADQMSVQPSGFANEVYFASAINPDAGFFINLPFGMMEVLAWGMLAGLLCLAVLGVMQRSFAMAILPGLVFIVSVTMIGQEWFRVYNYSWYTENPVAVAAIITGVASVVLAVVDLFNRWRPTMIPRAPDAPPAETISQRRDAEVS